VHHFLKHPFFQELWSLNLPRSDFAIVGSGPLYARYLVTEIGDVDVVARGAAWKLALQLAEPTPAPYSSAQQIQLFNGDIEILDSWFPEYWKVDELIDGADLIEDIRFVTMNVVWRGKQELLRPIDLVHLRSIQGSGSDEVS
jgi:hypothetical protein